MIGDPIALAGFMLAEFDAMSLPAVRAAEADAARRMRVFANATGRTASREFDRAMGAWYWARRSYGARACDVWGYEKLL